MIPDRLAVVPGLPTGAFSNPSVQLELARNYRLGEVTFANEIGNDVNIFDCVRIEKKDRVAQARFFFPKRALHIGKNISTPNLGPMRQGRRARIRIHGLAMPDAE